MIEALRARYNPKRLALVDADFLEFEEDMISETDLQRIQTILDSGSGLKLPNTHNSILLYLLGITDEFDFERERADTIGGTPPDIDIDFHDRATAIDWTIKRWGDDNVAKILTHGTYGVRSGIDRYFKTTAPDIQWDKDHSRKLNQKALDEHWGRAQYLTEHIPADTFGKAADMKKMLEQSPELEKDEALDAWRQYMHYVEDKIFQYGVHASGVVVSDFPLYEVMPLMAERMLTVDDAGDDVIQMNRITQYTMNECEYLGTIKFDFLGIDNLSIVDAAIKLIKENHGVSIDMYDIEDGDTKTYQMLAQGLLSGIFQFETSGSAKRLVMTCGPKSIEELSDLSALNRPGPLAKQTDDAGNVIGPSIADMYIENKANGFAPDDMPQALADLLESTYWAMVYQEQVMRICSDLAGFTLREADDIRRAMGKKKKEVIEPMQKMFEEGCERTGKVDAGTAEILWKQMMHFADYAFNKSHSVSYSYLSYVCAWLKANYPAEFFAALMSVRSNGTADKWAKAPEFVFEAKAMGVNIQGPNINRSLADFHLTEGGLYWGFQAIKGIGASTGDAITRCRGNTKFADIWDFLDRVDRSKVNSGNFKSLALAGAFDCMGYEREVLFEQAQSLYDHLKLEEKAQEKQIALVTAQRENAQRDTRKEELDRMLKSAKDRKKAKEELTVEDEWILDRADRLRRLRELARQCKLTNDDVSSVMTPEEVAEYEESMWLRSKPLPQVPAVPTRWPLQRHRQVPISVAGLRMQREYCGAYPSAHPVSILFPRSTFLANAQEGGYGLWAGEIVELKEITTRRGQKMAFATIEDSSARAELVFFPSTWTKLYREGVADKLNGSICQVKGRVEQLEPLKLIVDTVKLSEDNNEY